MKQRQYRVEAFRLGDAKKPARVFEVNTVAQLDKLKSELLKVEPALPVLAVHTASGVTVLTLQDGAYKALP